MVSSIFSHKTAILAICHSLLPNRREGTKRKKKREKKEKKRTQEKVIYLPVAQEIGNDRKGMRATTTTTKRQEQTKAAADAVTAMEIKNAASIANNAAVLTIASQSYQWF